MLSHLVLAVAALQGGAPPAAPLPPSPVARIAISPDVRQVQAGDTIRFTARALDATGQPVPGARILFRGGGEGGEIDSTGKLIAGTPGVIRAAITALVDGRAPKIEILELKLVPGPSARVVVRQNIKTLAIGQRITLDAASYSATGDERIGDVFAWSSSAPDIIRVEPNDGVITALSAGTATVSVATGRAVTRIPVTVVPTRVMMVEVSPVRATVRQGDVTRFKFTARDGSGKEITGLDAEWSMTGGEGLVEQDGAFVGYNAPAKYVVTANVGGRTAQAIVNVGYRDVRRPATVVSRLPRTQFPTSELWIHPNGTVAYLGTHGGGDRFYTIDIRDPAKPVIVDSVVMNTRLVNDIMTTADGKYLVATREGAADRKNGIVICSLEDPLRPKVISEFTDGVTSGVHSAFVYTQPRFGTHVYLTNDGTGAMHVIDINDPAKPKEVAVWKTPRPDAGRYLHDVDVQDGLLYGSWWNDGLVILDVGNGIRGGTPAAPKLVSQFKYDLTAMYRDVGIESGAAHTRGTHTAWRHKNYVFIADEVYRGSEVKGAKDAAADQMFGNLQVIDVSDITKPRSVARYKPEYGGVHNVWVAGDTLYMGVYDGGFRVFDISGELRGDLREQGREIASVYTGDMDGNTKNKANTWGVVVNKKDGLAYVNDFFNGLWVIRIEPRARVIVP